jgi:hypothetical protein
MPDLVEAALDRFPVCDVHLDRAAADLRCDRVDLVA